MASSRIQQKPRQNKDKQVSEALPSLAQPTDLKSAVIQVLHDKGILTRGEITTLTGIPRTSVYDVLTKLLLDGIVEKYIEHEGRRGRPRIYYQLTS